MRNVIYFGNSIKMVQFLLSSSIFDLNLWISEKRFKESQEKLTAGMQVNHQYVENINELENLVSNITIPDLVIMYSFGIIISPNIIQKINVYNFHPGSLEKNRGRNPIEWAILLGWNNDEMSLHKIDEKIDTGLLISSKTIDIDSNDTVSAIQTKMENSIPSLLNDLEDYLSGKRLGKVVVPGVYRKRISESDFTIDLENDSLETIKNKIRSQKDYNGAIVFVKGEKHHVKSLDDFIFLTGRGV